MLPGQPPEQMPQAVPNREELMQALMQSLMVAVKSAEELFKEGYGIKEEITDNGVDRSMQPPMGA